MKLSGKCALVTGAGRGIGLGCALELAAAGAAVAINDLHEDRARSAVDRVAELGGRAFAASGDIFDRAGCESVVARVLGELGRIDILVSNPARNVRAAFVDLDPEQFQQVIGGTLVGGFHISQLVSRHMIERGEGGKIVFISSIHHRIPFARSVAYNAAKSGLVNMAFTMANELAAHRINVNVIEPGWIDTPGEHESFGSDALVEAGPQMPWGRLGLPADIGKAAVFLCSGDADYITGTSLLVDGGQWMRFARE